MQTGTNACEIAFGFLDHKLRIDMASRQRASFSLRAGPAVCDLHTALRDRLAPLGVRAHAHPHPYKRVRTIQFVVDRAFTPLRRGGRAARPAHAGGDRRRVRGVSRPLCGHAHARAHLFSQTCDPAPLHDVPRAAPPMPGANRLTRKADSHRVVGLGFQAGDENVPPRPSTRTPLPRLAAQRAAPLAPSGADRTAGRHSALAIDPFEDARTAAARAAAPMRFPGSACRAGQPPRREISGFARRPR